MITLERYLFFFLKNKPQAFDKFRNWKLLVEKQTNRLVNALRMDNGLEFCNHEFKRVCKSNGILWHTTVTYTPKKKNGVIERVNRTLLNKVRCLITTSDLPKSCLGEVVATTTYLINRSPSRAIELKTPKEAWNTISKQS